MTDNLQKIGLVFRSLLNESTINMHGAELSIYECDDDSYIFGELNDGLVMGYDVTIQQMIDYAANLTESDCVGLSFSNAMKKLQNEKHNYNKNK